MDKNDLSLDEYSPYYKMYIESTEGLTIPSGLIESRDKTISFYNSIPLDKIHFRYAADKWNVKEVLQHINDTERVFCYRALCISRNDKTPLPNYDQDAYIENCDLSTQTIENLIKEYKAIRASTLSLFNSLTTKELIRTGVASGNTISVRAIAFILMGHEIHHCNILNDRYL